ncbi:helix-turn-helix transcriptional regulator [Mycobacterium sp. pUA109]|uniref:helix-turn-helix transcriptional regulator n=1 Tax=Mycobacterium sp. pUA109 TaxID=3238982 RepID=UPI00351B4428
MITVDEFSRIVSAIHSSAVTPDNWTAVVDDVRRTLDAKACALVVADGKNRSVKSGSILAEARTSYDAYYHQVDYVLEAVETSPVGLIRGGRSLTALHSRSEFHADWLRPHQMQDGLFVRVTDGSAPTSFLVAGPRRPEPFVKLVSALVPHLQQALRTEAHLKDLHHRSNGLHEAAQALRHGVVIVAAGSRVVYTNAAADRMLRSADGVRIRAGHLEAVAPGVDAELQHGIHAALAADSTERCGTSFACPRRCELRPYLIDVLPLDSSPHGAMLVVVDPEDQPEPPAALLRRVYGLTSSEADIALLVLHGHGLQHIGDQLSLSQATVKTHLQHIFDKTNTHRQAELVRVLLALRPVCR